jgi:hypothetical protein
MSPRCYMLSSKHNVYPLKTWHFFVKKEMAMVHWSPPSIFGVFLFFACLHTTYPDFFVASFLLYFKELNKITKKKGFQVSIFKTLVHNLLPKHCKILFLFVTNLSKLLAKFGYDLLWMGCPPTYLPTYLSQKQKTLYEGKSCAEVCSFYYYYYD